MSNLPAHGADASIRPRSRSGVLTPSSDDVLNRNNERSASVSAESRKRKRVESVTMAHLLDSPITIQAHPRNIHAKPRVLHPLMLLPREHLSFASIDLATPQGDLLSSRFFESRIKIVELESRMGSSENILIARHDRKGMIFALDRQENGFYVVFKLGSWIDMDYLVKNATVVCQERIAPRPVRPDTNPQDVPPGITRSPPTHRSEKNKMNAIAAIQSLVRKRDRSQSVAACDHTIKNDPTSDPQTVQPCLPSPRFSDPVHCEQATSTAQADGELVAPTTTEDIFDNIRKHYFEALYKSKGSLAFFAKGPLSRARSTFQLDLEATLDIVDLIEFLKTFILSTVQIDKKYREKIPDIISKMNASIESSDEGKKKQRKPKKMKLSKDGLYPLEDENIQKWWLENKPEEPNDSEARGISLQQIKSHASLLRTRETQLQMIIIMEIMALEPLKSHEQTADSVPTLPGESQVDVASLSQQPKKRNKHNLPVLIDVHADRLTIWQSTASDELLLLEDSQTAGQSTQTQIEPKSSTEPLKDFCVDVVLPFYASRLPQLCETLNRKLGGPVAVQASSKSRSSAKKYLTKVEKKPGSAARRPEIQRDARTLERALSLEQESRRSMSRGPSNALALMRSSTSAAIPTIKREGSDSALFSTASKAEPGLAKQRLSSLSRSASMADLRDSKSIKQAKVDAQLKDAISALRKPNRNIVGQAMEEAAERRASTLVSAKKARKFGPPRPSPRSQVLVEATPASQRFKNIFAVKPEHVSDVPLPTTEDAIPPSSVGAPGASTVRRNPFWNIQAGRSPAINSIDCTPTKASKSADFLAQPVIKDAIGCTPTKSSNLFGTSRPSVKDAALSGLCSTPSRNPRAVDVFSRASIEGELGCTPTKFDRLAHDGAGFNGVGVPPSSPLKSHMAESPMTPMFPSRAMKPVSKLDLGRRPSWNKQQQQQKQGASSVAEKENSVSIYSKLGWDDDLDDLL